MSDTIPNIVVPANTVVDIYADAGVAAAGIVVGTRILVEMLAQGEAKLYAGAALAIEPDNDTGYNYVYPRQSYINTTGDAGGFIWSKEGCTINVQAV